MQQQSFTRSEKWIIGIFVISEFLLHFIINLNGAYGFFRDELYYIACSEHLSWGYVDQPPLSLFILKVSRLILGDSLVAIRFVPALAIGLTLLTAALIGKEMGGRLLAILLTCVAVFVSPMHIAMGSFYSMNSIDILIWSVIVLLVLKIFNTERKWLWIMLGIVMGLGLLNKINVLFLGTGLVVGLMITNRKTMLTPWPYVAGLSAMLFFLPYVIWNIQHDFAHLEFIKSASAGKYSGRSVLNFIGDVLMNHNPFLIPFWIAGLWAIFFYHGLKPYSIIGWLFLVPFLILIANGTSKGEYLSPAFVIVFAAGSVYVEQKLKASRQWIGYLYSGLLMILNVIFIPIVTPVLSIQNYIQYAKYVGMEPGSSENKEVAELPQFYADMFGWSQKAKDVALVYNTLSDQDKQLCAIFSTNYGRCGAIDFFGKQYGLPPSIGNHNNYWIWGPRNYTGEVVIILGGNMEDHVNDFESCTLAGISTCDYCMPYENNVNIFLCRGLKKPLGSTWSEIKHYD